MAGINTQPFVFDSFLGGWTDEPLSGDKNQYTRMDNLFMNDEGDVYTRDGSAELLFPMNAQVGLGGSQAHLLFNYGENSNLLAAEGGALAVLAKDGDDNDIWQEIAPPTGGMAFAAGGHLQAAEWKKIVYIATSKKTPITKVFKDQGGTFHCITAGLPFMAEPDNGVFDANMLTLANEARSLLLSHFNASNGATYKPHRGVDGNAVGTLIAPPATNEATFIALVNQMVKAYGYHQRDAEMASVYHQKYETASPAAFQATLLEMRLETSALAETYSEACERLNDLRTKFSAHEGSSVLHNDSKGVYVFTAAPIPVASYSKGPYHEFNWGPASQVAENIRTAYNTHRAASGASNFHTAPDGTNVLTSPAVFDEARLELFVWDFRKIYMGVTGANEGHWTDANKTAGWLYHAAKETSSHALSGNARAASTALSDYLGGLRIGNLTGFVSALNEAKNRLNDHIKDTAAHAVPSPLTTHLVPSQDLSIASYGYAFTYVYKYTVGGLEFEDEGPAIYRLFRAWPIESNPLQIQGMVPLANTASTNYDLANIKIRIYRTTNGGKTFYLVAEIPNSDAEYVYPDSLSDAALQGQPQLYTNSGIPENEPPPLCKFVHIVDDYAFYANIDSGGSAYPFRIVQASPGDPDSVPGANYVDLPTDVVGMSSTKSNLVAFTSKSTYRIEGRFGISGDGGLRAEVISDQVGLAASYSPVQVDGGILFFGTDGVYFTDAYSVRKISRDWLKTYLSLISTPEKADAVRGALDSKFGRVWWGIQMAPDATSNDAALTLSLRNGQGLAENACFQTQSNGDFFGTRALAFYKNQLVRLDATSRVYKHDASYRTDYYTMANSEKAIHYDLRTVATDFGTTMYRKWVPYVVAKFRNLGSLSAQINSINDDGKSIHSLTPIRWRGKTSFGDQTIVTRGAGPGWSYRNLIESKRRFPSGTLRCSNKQLQLTLARVVITNSDELGLVTIDPVAKTATLLAGAWPTSYKGHSLSLAHDGYVTEWEVAFALGATLSIVDAGNTLPVAGNYKFLVRGYPKDEKMQLISLTLHYAPLGTQQPNPVGESGANA